VSLTHDFNKSLANKDLSTQQKYLLNNKMAATSGFQSLAKINKKIVMVLENIAELNTCKHYVL